jgi:hypothetical protein
MSSVAKPLTIAYKRSQDGMKFEVDAAVTSSKAVMGPIYSAADGAEMH